MITVDDPGDRCNAKYLSIHVLVLALLDPNVGTSPEDQVSFLLGHQGGRLAQLALRSKSQTPGSQHCLDGLSHPVGVQTRVQ